ncbi:hypothetical protein [Paractinoplanes lichenicola]|uniref:hypothetical protein n=1 Tax=Paractinoplanes lichenicola TaxID=2802976 RepID=UPI0027DE5B59|nr:hypothetical protein [Actinoplanes lichenicola]
MGQDAAGVFELLDEDVVEDEVDEPDEDEELEDDESPEDEVDVEDVDDGVELAAASFFVDSLLPDFSAPTLPERESFR